MTTDAISKRLRDVTTPIESTGREVSRLLQDESIPENDRMRFKQMVMLALAMTRQGMDARSGHGEQS